ncbi:MAG: A/G-specific adenine glycosylase, partial [Firmicutes bacterium]|nr:A/G-specific adenine glycosylase [Bacillota bacterium]
MKHVKYQAQIEAVVLQDFQEELLSWYSRTGRDLPWRHTRDPYHILVSEILLHQTTVATVRPIYETFLQRYPTIGD